MRKIINIDEKEIEVVANAATPFRFKQIFKTDLIMQLGASKGDGAEVNIITELAYVMSKQADGSIAKASQDDFYKWLEDFGSMAFVESAEDILGVYMGSENNQSAKPKKESGQA